MSNHYYFVIIKYYLPIMDVHLVSAAAVIQHLDHLVVLLYDDGKFYCVNNLVKEYKV